MEDKEFRELIDRAKKLVPIERAWRELGLEGSPGKTRSCPWREDKHPSFSVFDDGRACYDHGAGQGGDVFYFVEKNCGCSRSEAMELVFKWAGIEWKRASNAKRRSPAFYRPVKWDRAAALLESARAKRVQILTDYECEWPWPGPEEEFNPRHGIAPSEEWRLMLDRLYGEDDLIWIGQPWHSGVEQGKLSFRTKSEWLSLAHLPGAHFCPSIFRPGSVNRSAEQVQATRYLVIDGDEVIGRKPVTAAECEENRRACAAVSRWMVERLRMRLVAIVDTGNKSLHSWFLMPSEENFLELKAMAPGLGLDQQLFTSSQPCRLPGFPHEKTGRLSRVLYICPPKFSKDSMPKE